MATPGEDRIAELESKVRELEALTRGLTDEMLDLKSIVMKLNSRVEERKQAAPRPSVMAASRKEAPAAEATKDAGKEGASMEMIMQPDGTLKPERRTTSDYIIASGRYPSKNLRKGKGGDEKEGGAPLIYATEDDSTTDDSVVIKKKK